MMLAKRKQKNQLPRMKKGKTKVKPSSLSTPSSIQMYSCDQYKTLPRAYLLHQARCTEARCSAYDQEGET